MGESYQPTHRSQHPQIMTISYKHFFPFDFNKFRSESKLWNLRKKWDLFPSDHSVSFYFSSLKSCHGWLDSRIMKVSSIDLRSLRQWPVLDSFAMSPNVGIHFETEGKGKHSISGHGHSSSSSSSSIVPIVFFLERSRCLGEKKNRRNSEITYIRGGDI